MPSTQPKSAYCTAGGNLVEARQSAYLHRKLNGFDYAVQDIVLQLRLPSEHDLEAGPAECLQPELAATELVTTVALLRQQLPTIPNECKQLHSGDPSENQHRPD